MTELAFHFGAVDPLLYTCRLLRKAVGSGARVVVRTDVDTARRLDAELWEIAPTDFVAHCGAQATVSVRSRSPVLLVDTGAVPLDEGYSVLVNLANDVPDAATIDAFERLIEIVGLEEDQRQAARSRWKQYTAQGRAIQRHDLTQRPQ